MKPINTPTAVIEDSLGDQSDRMWKFLPSIAAWVHANWTKVRPWITPQALASRRTLPKNTFHIVIDALSQPWWHKGKLGGEPTTQIHARYYLTNITDEKMLVVECKLKPVGGEQTFDVSFRITQMRDDEERPSTIIVTMEGSIYPAIVDEGETLEAQVIFVDQFGNENLGPVTSFLQN